MPTDEGSLARARRDTIAVYGSIKFGVATVALDATLGAVGVVLGSTTEEQIGAAVGGALGGTLIALVSVFLVRLVLAPVRQRDEARKELRRLATPALLPVSSAEESALSRRLGTLTHAGRRLLVEAGEIQPVGNLDAEDDLVRRIDGWEAAVADELASDDQLPAWREWWLRGPERQRTKPPDPMRGDWDEQARQIGERLRGINEMRRVLADVDGGA